MNNRPAPVIALLLSLLTATWSCAAEAPPAAEPVKSQPASAPTTPASTPASASATPATPDAAEPAEAKYPIKLSRPFTKGRRFKVHVKDEITSIAQNKANPSRIEKMTYALDGVVTVLNVDDRGEETKISCQISSCTSNGKPLLPSGTIVIAESRGSESAYTGQGIKLAGDVNKALGYLLPMPDGGPTDDQLFGTSEPQAMGATWSGDKAIFAKKFGVQPELVSGYSKLVRLEKVGGVDCLIVETSQDWHDKESLGQYRDWSAYPLDTTAMVLRDSDVVTVTTSRGPVSVSVKGEKTVTRTPL